MSAKTIFVVIVLAVACPHALSRHEDVGVYPQFKSEQEDKVVFETNVDGAKASLSLACNVMGTPQPTIKWFRENVELGEEFVMAADGTLLIPNITDGEYASISGVLYYCEATNFIGEANFSANIRSSDVNVTYAFFNGFSNMEATDVIIPVATNIDIALECDVLDANPPPVIQWFRSTAPNTPVVNSGPSNDVRLLDGGRFLYVRNIMEFTETFHCAVANALIHQTNTSGTRYILNGTGLSDLESFVYKEIGNLTAFVGDTDLEFSYVAAVGVNQRDCTYFVDEIEVSDLAAIGEIMTVALPVSGGTISVLSCKQNGVIIASGTLRVFERANITMSPVSNREAIVGEGSITFSCPYTGTPSPSLSWYYNGQVITASSGVMIQNDMLSIASHQTDDSGVYQCLLKNSVSKFMASWLLEVREPEMPQIVPLNLTQINATKDRRVGTLIVRETGSVVELDVYVQADPCPDSFQWTFNGTLISNGDDYSVSTNPCSDPLAVSPFLYNLTVNNLTIETSGPYSVNFTNLAGGDTLSPTYITVPVQAENVISGLTLEVVDDPVASCFLNDSVVILTCQTEGFPRPTLEFRVGKAIITPGIGAYSEVSSPFSDQISISIVSRSAEGSYSCDDTASTTTSGSTAFSFCTKPEILSSDVTPNINAGDELAIQCQVGGEPQPEVTWTKDDTTLVDNSPALRIITLMDDISSVEVEEAGESNSGRYVCTATNDAGFAFKSFMVTVSGGSGSLPALTVEQIIGISAGGAGAVLLVVLFILLLVCVFMCARRSKKGGVDLPYNVSGGGKMYTDYSADGRGNVDRDSDEEDGVQPEAFNPEYESLPALRPTQPPIYKPTPSYPHGAPLTGDDMEMVKVPPPDTDSFVGVPPYRKDNGAPDYRPSPDDFLSEDAQFV